MTGTGADAPLRLEASAIAKRFGAVVALRAADLAVRAGEVHALMGANGAGKSTLLKILTGALRPDSGTILIEGRRCTFASPAAARQAGVASVYQDPALVPDLTIAQNLRLSGVPAAAVRVWLERFGFGRFDFAAVARTLPLPTLRLVDLARALATEPLILLLDEITAALPADLTVRVFDVVQEWRGSGRSVLFVSHRLTEISALCDRATVLRDGVAVGVVAPARGGEEEIVSLMLGGAAAPASARSADARRAPRAAVPALEVRGLRSGPLLNDVSLAIAPGEVLGLAALEGQGQEALFACLAGLRRPEAGTILIEGRTLRFHHPADAIRAGVAFVPADRLDALLHQRSVRENIALPMHRRLHDWGLIAMRRERARVDEAVRRLKIDTRAEQEVRRLSGGNQQKVVIARWLAAGFRVLLCFDPTRGIDIGTKRQIYALIRALGEDGAAVLLFTSELPEIALTCDRAAVLFGGRIVAEMPAIAADEEQLLRAAHGLVARRDQAA
jgi:ribose transport system ATP-binding protein